MSDDDRPPALKRFVADLNKIWTAAGPPSFAEVEALSRKFTRPVDSGLRVQVLVHSTTQGILAGQRSSLPKWQWVASFVVILRVVASQSGVNPDSLGTLPEWKAKHEAAAEELRQARLGDHESDETDQAVVRGGPPAPSPQIVRRFLGVDARVRPTAGLRLIHGESERHWLPSLLISASRTITLDWWHDYGDLVPEWFKVYLSLEPGAALIRGYETEWVPDLLQTEQYAEAVIRTSYDGASAREVRRRVELLMSRQEILNRADPPRLWLILDETTLRRPVGDVRVMREQLDHLIELSQRTNIILQLMPDADGHAIGGGSIVVLRFAEPELPDLSYLQQPAGGLYPSERGDRVHFGQVLDRLAIEAEPRDMTIDFLRRLRGDI